MIAEESFSVPTKQVLGIKFFDGSAQEVVAYAAHHGGLVVAPAAPSFIALQDDPEYRKAIADADLAIADSGWMVNFWWLLHHERITRISGLKFFKCLLDLSEVRTPGNFFWIVPSETSKTKALTWSHTVGLVIPTDNLYVAPFYGKTAQDPQLLQIIQEKKPQHIVVGIGGGMQDKIGSYIKHACGYRPGIYCIGAAPGFVTGDQVRIPMWADHFYLGWLFRLFIQPHIFIPRFWSVRRLPWLIFRYGKELPPLTDG